MKKVTINSNALKSAVKKLAPAVNSKSILAVMKSILVDWDGSRLQMIATDLEITVGYEISVVESAEKDPFQVLIPFQFLSDVISLYSNIPVSIEHPTKTKIRIVAGQDVYELKGLESVDTFPKVPAMHKKPIVTFSSDLIESLSRAIPTASKEDIRPAMTRILVEVGEKDTNVVSTNGTALFLQFFGDIAINTPEKIQFSSKAVKVLEGLESVSVGWTEKKISIKSGQVSLWFTRHEDVYPNYRAVIPSYPANLTIDREDLINALQKNILIAGSTDHTKFDLNPDSMTLHSEGDSQTASTSIAAQYSGSVTLIALQPQLLIKVLGQVDADELSLHIDQPNKAVLITAKDKPGYLGMVMPVMI